VTDYVSVDRQTPVAFVPVMYGAKEIDLVVAREVWLGCLHGIFKDYGFVGAPGEEPFHTRATVETERKAVPMPVESGEQHRVESRKEQGK